MKKLIRIASLVLLSSVVLIGCGKGDGDASSSSSSAPPPTLEETLGYTATDLLSNDVDDAYVETVCEGEIKLKTINDDNTVMRHTISEQSIQYKGDTTNRVLATTSTETEKTMTDDYYVYSTDTVYEQLNYNPWKYYTQKSSDPFTMVIKNATDTSMELNNDIVYVTGELAFNDSSSMATLIREWLKKYDITSGKIEFTSWYDKTTRECKYVKATITSEASGKYQDKNCLLESMEFYYVLTDRQEDKKVTVPDNVKLTATLDESKQQPTTQQTTETSSQEPTPTSQEPTPTPAPTSQEPAPTPTSQESSPAPTPTPAPTPDIDAPPA